MNARIRTSKSGNKTIRFSTEVEINEFFDVDVEINLAECIDDIIDAMTPEHLEIVANKAIRKLPEASIGDNETFKRHLCDLVGLNYHCSTGKLMEEILNRL